MNQLSTYDSVLLQFLDLKMFSTTNVGLKRDTAILSVSFCCMIILSGSWFPKTYFEMICYESPKSDSEREMYPSYQTEFRKLFSASVTRQTRLPCLFTNDYCFGSPLQPCYKSPLFRSY